MPDVSMGYSVAQMEAVAKEVGTLTVNLLLSEQSKAGLIDEIKARDVRIDLLTNAVEAHRADIDRLREQVGAKPVKRR